MKLELSRNGLVLNLNQIEIDGVWINLDSKEPGRSFIAYPISDAKNELEKNIAKNFDDFMQAIRVFIGENVDIDREWIAAQLAERSITIQKIDSRPQLFCSECQNILSLEDDLREDGVRRIFAKPCEKCIEHAKEEAIEEYSENSDCDNEIRVGEFLV
jgi:hypothetical protein